MKKAVAALLLGSALICGWIFHSRRGQPLPQRQEANAVKNRHFALSIETPKSTYRIGEDIVVFFKIRNVSNQHFSIVHQSGSGSNFHHFAFTDSTGYRIAQTRSVLALGPMSSADVGPNQSIQHNVRLNSWQLAGTPGHPHPYTDIGKQARTIYVTGTYGTPAGITFTRNVWRGMIQSEPIRIQIVE